MDILHGRGVNVLLMEPGDLVNGKPHTIGSLPGVRAAYARVHNKGLLVTKSRTIWNDRLEVNWEANRNHLGKVERCFGDSECYGIWFLSCTSPCICTLFKLQNRIVAAVKRTLSNLIS